MLGGTRSVNDMVYMRGEPQAGAAFTNLEAISSESAAVGDRGQTHHFFRNDSPPECNNVIPRAKVIPNAADLSIGVRQGI